jgi:hypothetical protein
VREKGCGLWLHDGRSEGDPSLDPGWPLSTTRPSDGVCVDVIRAAMVEQGGGDGDGGEPSRHPCCLATNGSLFPFAGFKRQRDSLVGAVLCWRYFSGMGGGPVAWKKRLPSLGLLVVVVPSPLALEMGTGKWEMDDG